MSAVLLFVGLLSLALGALSGFALLVAVDHPERLRRLGVVDPVRVRQVHLDWIIMGTVMSVTALAVPGMWTLTAGLVLLGGVVNPATFIPMAFSRTVAATRTFQIVSFISFTALTSGLILAVIQFALGHGAITLLG
jgi:hydroxylaminobenzene mutase